MNSSEIEREANSGNAAEVLGGVARLGEKRIQGAKKSVPVTARELLQLSEAAGERLVDGGERGL